MGSLGGYVSPYGVYLDPERVFLLVINRRPRDLFNYVHSIPGAPADLRCRLVGFAERALQAPRLGNWWPDESSWTLYWAMYAWAHADAMLNRLCAPQISGNPSNFDAVPRNAAMLNQLYASSSSTPTATLSPQQEDVINFLISRARPLNRTSAFNWATHTSDFAQRGTDSTLALAFGNLSLGQPGSQQMAPRELMQNSYGTPAMRVPSLHQPGPAQLTPQGMMQNREVLPAVDVKGKGPALGVGQQDLRVHVACLMADDGTTGAAGLLIKRETWQFICALCFPMRSTEETVLFAAACCEGIKVAQAYQPTSIVLESHLFHLVDLLLGGAHAPCRDMEELTTLLHLSHCRVQHITEDSNGAARRLAMHCLLSEEAEIYFSAPDWLVLT
ncbi:hypothetical protein CFC21_096737 [Triticum aestivum]|uniref:RNase H type-1 domain-containing protein n=3 Tax=Triticum aestivum TaxID=4565 RepID=A0A9R1LT37_WHEAT|nr:hypothetical protein CFC21_096737 [Triticum aestivum]